MWLRILVLSGVFLMGLTSCGGGPDLALLVDFVTDDDELMQDLWDAAGDPGLGTDVTVLGPLGGSCHWTIEGNIFGTEVTYDYQGYDRTGLVMDGVRFGNASLFVWTLTGTIELSGTGDGWIYYSLPMNGLIGPAVELRTWRVCNRDTGCTTPVPINNPPTIEELAGTTFFTHFSLP
jgi:hypothetical protein